MTFRVLILLAALLVSNHAHAQPPAVSLSADNASPQLAESFDITRLRDRLRSADPDVRQQALMDAAARAAALRGSSDRSLDSIRPLVAEALSDAAPQIRRAAILALANLDVAGRPSDQLLTGLSPALVQLFTATYLGETHRDVKTELIRNLATGAEDGSDVRAVLTAGLVDEDAGVRQFALIGVGRLRAHELLPPAVACLTHPDAEVRRAAVRALAAFDDGLSAFAPQMAAAAQAESDPDIRTQLQRLLAGLQ